jgi:signal transduction histidine kinase
MRVLSTRFRTIQRLENFIKSNDLTKTTEDLYIKILLPNDKKDRYRELYNLLKDFVDSKNIFGVISDSALLNSVTVDDIVIIFILVEKSKAKLFYSKNLYQLNSLEKNSFSLLYAVDVEKEQFLTSIDSGVDLVGSFFHEGVIYGENIFDSGIVVFQIERYFELNLKIVESITPIGRELKVDKAKNREIFSIENFSPKELYEHYLTKRLSKNLVEASYTFPLLKGSLSSLILSEKKNSISVEYQVENGDILRLGYTNSLHFYDSYEDNVLSFKDSFSDAFFILFSVAKRNFFKENGFEYDDAIGLMTKSEVAVFDGKIHNLTHSIIMININYQNQKRLKYKRFKPLKIGTDAIVELDALSNIAKVSSNELENLNKKLEKRVKQEVEKNLKKDSIMIHQTRLAQMGEMMSLIAHQWKQPLSAISATSSGLHIKIELDMYDKEFFLKSLTKIEEFVNHLSTTIDDFSNFFKPSKRKKEFFMYEAVDKALSIATYSLSKKSIDLVLDIDKNLKVKTYQNELVQVLLNLIKNAENILIKREIKEPKIWIKVYKSEDGNVIEIIDNGGGIDKKILPKIFEPYFSTKATKDSTGLGLYMSKFIVEDSLGGKLIAENNEKGAVFSIVLV